MKNKLLNFYIILILGMFLTSFNSTYILLNNVNPYLINSVRFLLLSSLIFIFYERRILLNLKYIYKKALILGFILSIYSVFFILQLNNSNPFSSSLLFIIPLMYVFMKNKITLISISISIILLIIENINMFNIIYTILLILFLIIALEYYKKHSKNLNNYITENIFITTGIIAILNIVLFFITKPDTAPFLSNIQIAHLIMLILTGSLIPAIILIYINKSVFLLNKNTIILLLLVLSRILNFDYTVFNLIIFAILFVPFIVNMKKDKAGFSKIETFALLVVLAIIGTLLIPFIQSFKNDSIVKKDRVLLQDKRTLENVFQIGDSYIKFINSKPVYLYEYKNNKFLHTPIQ